MSRADSFNPYEAPRAEVAARLGEFPTLSPGQFSVGEVMSRGWAVFRARMGLCFGIVAVGFLINFGLSFAQSMAIGMFQAVGTDPSIVLGMNSLSSIVAGLLNFFVSVGQTLAFLKVARGRPAGIGDLFAGGSFYLKLFGASLVIGLLGMLGMLVGAIPGGILMATSGPRDAMAIGVLVLGVLIMLMIMSVFWVRVSQYMYAGIDHPGLGAMDTIRRSMDLTRGHFWGISGVYFLIFLINIAGALMLLVGLLFTIPLSFAMIATMYALLAGEPTVAEKPAPEFLA